MKPGRGKTVRVAGKLKLESLAKLTEAGYTVIYTAQQGEATPGAKNAVAVPSKAPSGRRK